VSNFRRSGQQSRLKKKCNYETPYTVTKIIDTIALLRVVPWDYAILRLN
jgi:hypothetical protein